MKTINILCAVTFIVLLILKIAQVGLAANMSWWWVFSPFIIGCVVTALLYLYGLHLFVKAGKKHAEQLKNAPSKWQQRLDAMAAEQKNKKA